LAAACIGMALPASATSAAPAATVVDPRRPLRILGIEMPPFTMATAYGVTGMLPEMCQLLFERLKQPLQFDVVPWARAVLMLKTGEADGLIPMFKSPERERQFSFSKAPVYRADMSLFGRIGELPKWSRLSDLYGFSFVKLRGALFAPEFDRAVSSGAIRCEEASSLSAAIRMVDARRVDFAAAARLSGLQLIASEGLGHRVAPLEPPLFRQDFHLAMPRTEASNQLLAALDIEVVRAQADGSFARIEEAYRKRNWLPRTGPASAASA
jgi:polar amino acid transport system substrate-binding protein